jgi:hypothetical protein
MKRRDEQASDQPENDRQNDVHPQRHQHDAQTERRGRRQHPATQDDGSNHARQSPRTAGGHERHEYFQRQKDHTRSEASHGGGSPIGYSAGKAMRLHAKFHSNLL